MFCSVKLQEVNPNDYNSVDDVNAKMYSAAVEVIGKGSGLG